MPCWGEVLLLLDGLEVVFYFGFVVIEGGILVIGFVRCILVVDG